MASSGQEDIFVGRCQLNNMDSECREKKKTTDQWMMNPTLNGELNNQNISVDVIINGYWRVLWTVDESLAQEVESPTHPPRPEIILGKLGI